MENPIELLHLTQAELAAAQARIATLEAQLNTQSTPLDRYEQILRYAADFSRDVFALVNAQGRIEYVSPTVSRVLGYSPDDYKHLNLEDTIHPEERDRVMAVFAELLAVPGERRTVETRIEHKDGHWLWVEMNAINALHDPDLQAVLISGRDISRRKDAQYKLQSSLEKYQLLAESIPDALFVLGLDANGAPSRVIEVNASTCQMLGYSREELLQLKLTDIDAPGTADEPEDIFSRLQAGEHVVFERDHVTRSGTRIPVEVHAVMGVNHGQPMVISLARDISRRRATEQDLRQFESAVRQTDDGIAITEADFEHKTRFRFVNAAFTRITGYTLEEINQLVESADMSQIPAVLHIGVENFADLARMIERGEVYRGKTHGTRKDGVSLVIQLSITPISSEGGRRLRFVTVLRDVTERETQFAKQIQAEAELKRLNSLLEEHVKERTAQLERSNSRIEAIFNHSGDGILLLDIEQGIQQTNRAFDDLLGELPEYSLGKHLDDLFETDVDINIPVVIIEVAQTHQRRQIEAHTKRADGARYDVEISIAPVNRPENTVTNLVCIIRDVRERIQAQRSIAEERNLLRTVIDTVPDFIFVKDSQHRFLMQNVAHARFKGFDNPAAIVGKTDRELYPAEMAAKFMSDEAALFTSGESVIDKEERPLGVDGQGHWMSTTKVPLRNLAGEIIGLVGINRDIERRKASEDALREREKQLRESQKMLQLVLDTIPVRVFWKNRDSVYLGCNRLFAGDAGLERTADIVGKRDEDLPWLAMETATYRADDAAVMNSGVPKLEYEEIQHSATRGSLILQTNKLPLKDEDGAVIGLLGSYVDITARKQMESTLAKKYEEEREIQNYLKALHSITIQLSRIDNLDDFYRGVVEHGRNHFGFERMGFLLYDAKRSEAIGTFGTDIHGQLTDERGLRWDISGRSGRLKRTLDSSQRFIFEENAPLYQDTQYIGNGATAAVALWDGGILGWLSIDNGVNHKPIARTQLDILALYALAIGPLLARKHAEWALRESEVRYRLLAENVKDLIIKLSPEGTITFVTPSVYQLLGYTPEEVVGQSGFSMVHPDDAATSLRVVDEALKAGDVYFTLIERLRRKDGQYIWVEAANTTVYDPVTGSPLELIGVIRDITERRKAEQALRESEGRYRMVINTMSEGIVLQDEDGIVRTCNAAAEAILELTMEQMMGQAPIAPRWQTIHEDGSPFPPETHPSMVTLRTGMPQSNVVMGVNKPAGTQTWISINTRPVVEAGDELQNAVVCTFSDITQRLQAERALQNKLEEEHELQGYFQTLHQITIELTQVSTLDDFYRQVVELGISRLGFDRMGLWLYDPSQNFAIGTYGTDDHGSVQPEPHIQFRIDPGGGMWKSLQSQPTRYYLEENAGLQHNREIVDTGWNAIVALSYGDRNLGWITVDNLLHHKPASPLQLEVLSQYGIYVAASLARRQAEEALQNTKDQLQAILDYSTASIFMKDLQDRVLLMNRAAETRFGVSTNTGIGKSEAELFQNGSSDQYQLQDEAIRTTGLPMSYEESFRGHIYWITKFPIFDHQGRIYAIGSTATDISDHKRYEESLERALRHEKELGELKSRFVSIASHEFRTPLAAILATAETLTFYRDRMNPDQINTRLNKIRQQVMHMKDILEDVLQHERINAGRVEFKPAQGDLDKLCQDIIEEFDSQPAYQGRIIYACTTAPVATQFDERLMRQVISNLISNGLKYSTDGKAIRVELTHDSSGLTLKVVDEGIGIPESDLKHLFEPFHRATNVGTIPGTGLGLSISRQAVELHGGRIQTESQTGKGTTFTVVLPNVPIPRADVPPQADNNKN